MRNLLENDHPTTLRIPIISRGPLTGPALEATSLFVMASFARSVYLHSPAGNILCLCRSDLPMGPFSLSCDQWERVTALGLMPGVPFLPQSEETLAGPDGLVLSWAGSALWLPPVSSPPAGLRDGLDRLRVLCGQFLPDEGLAPLLPWVLGGREDVGVRSSLAFALRDVGRQAMTCLSEWLDAPASVEGKASLDRGVSNLVGLGPGLTPSGDDVLGGAMLALGLAGQRDLLARLRDTVQTAMHGTNRISAAYMEAAAQGCGSSVLHDAVNAIWTDSPGLGQTLVGLGRMGHSSGWDALLGAVFIMRHLSA